MKQFKVSVLLLVCMVVVAYGCASIVSKSQYPVTINSQPDQAEIAITDENGKTVHIGKTPATVTLQTKAGYFSGKDYTISFSKEGYSRYTAQIKRGVDGWYIAGNLLFGGLIGWLIVDPLTGAMWTLDKEVNAVLSPQTSSSVNKGNLKIVLINDVPIAFREKMVRIN